MPIKKNITTDNEVYEVIDVIDKKKYKGNIYYKLKWADSSEPTWELAKNCHCHLLIKKYEDGIKKRAREEDENEWEVEEILKKRIVRNNEVEYLLKWRNWPGEPTWVKEKACECINLIAAFENPKLKKMWEFDGTNPRLWLDRDPVLKYMKKFARKAKIKVNLLEFEPDLPKCETQPPLLDGINIGPLSYRNHWYLVIILVNHISITRQVLVCDPLNTLLGVPSVQVHPVFKRLKSLFTKSYPVKPITMTPMTRSDLCAFYILAGFERALFLYQDKAKFVATKIYFDTSRPELIRCQLLPESNGEISVALPVSANYLGGPQCEFCDKFYETSSQVDKHIARRHFK